LKLRGQLTDTLTRLGRSQRRQNRLSRGLKIVDHFTETLGLSNVFHVAKIHSACRLTRRA